MKGFSLSQISSSSLLISGLVHESWVVNCGARTSQNLQLLINLVQIDQIVIADNSSRLIIPVEDQVGVRIHVEVGVFGG